MHADFEAEIRTLCADPARQAQTRDGYADWREEQGDSKAAAAQRQYATWDRQEAERRKEKRARQAAQRRLAKELQPVRKYLGMSGTPYPIMIEDGFAPPRLEGARAYHTTESGRVVHHPSAYTAKARSARLHYHGSTLRIIVGAGWLIENGIV